MPRTPQAFLSTAPGRAGIIGNPTDMYGGTVISCSTVERAAVLVEPADRMTFEVAGRRFVVRGTDDLDLDGSYFDIARAVVDFLGVAGAACRIRWACDVPFAAGLSSSAAMIVSLLNGIMAFLGRSHHRFQLAEMARQVDLHYMGTLCGYQDPYMSTFGGLNCMDFREKEFYRSIGEEPYGTVESLTPFVGELPFLLAHTGVRRSSGTVHKPIRERWLEGDPDVRQGYLRIAHLARIGKRAMLAGDWELLAELMTENHEIQRDLGGSGPENERLIEAALDGGALAAKLAGAGGGGTIIALCPDPDRRPRILSALRRAGASRFLVPRPCDGATVTPLEDEEAIREAERELSRRAAAADLKTN
jgi:galactokinase/mevalonate kinase-like predicted kinase